MTRPYIQQTIADLEALFQKSTNDGATLRKLAQELKHRKVPRAIALEERVAKALKSLSATPSPIKPAAVVPQNTLVVANATKAASVSVIPTPLSEREPLQGAPTTPFGRKGSKQVDMVFDEEPKFTPREDERNSRLYTHEAEPEVQPAEQPDSLVGLMHSLDAAGDLQPLAAYEILRVSPGAPWECVEENRREIVERSSPTVLAGIDAKDAEIRVNTARLANRAYEVIARTRLSQ